MRLRLVAAAAAITVTIAFTGTTACGAPIAPARSTRSRTTSPGSRPGCRGSSPRSTPRSSARCSTTTTSCSCRRTGSIPCPPLPHVASSRRPAHRRGRPPVPLDPRHAVPLGTNPLRPSGRCSSDGLNRLSRFPFGEITRVMWTNCFGGADTSDGGAADCLAEKGFEVAAHRLCARRRGRRLQPARRGRHHPLDMTNSTRRTSSCWPRSWPTYSAGRPVIVGGDFNLHTDGEPDATVFDYVPRRHRAVRRLRGRRLRRRRRSRSTSSCSAAVAASPSSRWTTCSSARSSCDPPTASRCRTTTRWP